MTTTGPRAHTGADPRAFSRVVPRADPGGDPAGRSGPPKAFRSVEDRLLGGVASGLAGHLGVSVMVVRGCFLILTVFAGFGLVLYAGLWLVLPAGRHLEQSAPGLEAATRQGRRPRRRTTRLEDLGPLVAMAAVMVGIAVLANGWAGGSFLFWPLLLGVIGVAVLWRQADEAQRERWMDSGGRINLARAVVGNGGAAAYARLAVGLTFLLGALVLFALQTGQAGVARDVLIAGALGVAGLALTAGPWLVRLAGDLSEERASRVRTEERADMAAHLHDSVLQTLALIQKHADNARTVATLARAQERDLRGWLYGDQRVDAATSLAGALRTAAAEVEDGFGVPVEVVTVGDTTNSDRLRPLVLAAREAMVNAARHSGADQVDVYAESDGRRCEVFVRDRGRGFDLGAVPEDRLGVRNSIEDRMRRHGGTAAVRTSPGVGTEVELVMTLDGTTAAAPARSAPEEESH